ncbi:MAG: 30S ribosomal protein S2, partial [Candidatus Hydrogenedentes bacterium]|nr:30S ribosomal protein S2 [Candidatus Hydrogenedentota bacterium]
MAVVTMRQLLEAGIHFGHQTRRWNPKMARYIFGQRNGIYIIDLQKTLRQVHKAHAFVRDTVAAGGTVLFVGTKKQAQEPVAREAKRCNMYYVNHRWLGGTLTNFETIQTSVRNLTRLEEMDASGAMEKYTKKEAAKMRREMTKLRRNLD